MKIAVGLSGGVDSAVAALLLLREGHEVSGVLMKLWPGPEAEAPVKSACYGPDEAGDIRAAGEVSAALGIPLRVIDCSRDYEALVLRYFREGYAAGRTPNPCVRCNQLVKFGVLPAVARASGLAFDRFATGHYARVERDERSGRFLLKRAADRSKDQSYFLYRLGQEQLASVLFPLGGLAKSRVREIAREAGLPVHDRKESQDFYGGDLGDIVGPGAGEGDIVDREGRVLGRHRGVRHYTVGQRKGLGIAWPVPLYVTGIEAGANRLVVGPESETLRRGGDRSRLRLGTVRGAGRPGRSRGPRSARPRARSPRPSSPSTAGAAGSIWRSPSPPWPRANRPSSTTARRSSAAASSNRRLDAAFPRFPIRAIIGPVDHLRGGTSMTGYLIAFVFGIFIMGALIAQRDRLGSGGFNAWLKGKKGLAVSALLGIVVIALIVQSLVTVQAGTVGVVLRLGAVRQELAPGLHVIVPFIDRVVIFPTLKKTTKPPTRRSRARPITPTSSSPP